MAFEAVIFDEGDTLYDASFWRKELYKKLSQMGYKKSFYGMVSAWEQKLVMPYEGKKSYRKAFEEFITSLGFNRAQLKEITEFSESLKNLVPKKRKLFPGEKTTLASLKDKGIMLAVLSDSELGEKKHRETLEALGIGSLLGVIVCSCETGYVKPQKQAYLKALERLGLPAAKALFVSHDQEELLGAKEAGLTTVSFNDKVYSPKDNEADHSIKSFPELLPITLEKKP